MAGNKLTKAEIVEQISESTKVSKKDIHAIIDDFFSEVKTALTSDPNGRVPRLWYL